MRVFISALILAIATCVSVPAPAAAQATGTSSSTKKPSNKPSKPKKPAEPKPPTDYRAFFVFDTEVMSASQSFSAVTGSSAVLGYGGGFQVANVWSRLFLRGVVSFQPASGQRVVPGTNVPNGIPVTINLQTIEAGAGWRMPLKKHPKYAVYFGGGMLFLNYSDSSPGAITGENTSSSFTGVAGEAGVEITLSKSALVGIEGQYRTVSATAPANSARQAFNENNLGGFAIRGMMAIRFGENKGKKK